MWALKQIRRDGKVRIMKTNAEGENKIGGEEEAKVEAHLASVDSIHSDDDNSDQDEIEVPSLRGTLYKWTNYLHGWQTRYFLLQDGTLAYYKSEHDTGFGCRGAVAIGKALIQGHESDDCRFDIAVNDSVWYLRADSPDERQRWIEALEVYKSESGYGSQGDLRRHGSTLSLTSTRSFASTSSFKKNRGLAEKLAELETFRDIVNRQVDHLQQYFDACAASAPSSVHDKTLEADDLDSDVADDETTPCTAFTPTTLENSRTNSNDSMSEEQRRLFHSGAEHSILDFKGEALTFKATTSGILSTLQHCIELMQQREESWKKRVDKEVEKRKRCEDHYKQYAAQFQRLQSQPKPVIAYGGPDYEEGPNSALPEEEWHDALDAALEQQDIEETRLERLMSRDSREGSVVINKIGHQRITLPKKHGLFSEIDQLAKDQLHYAKAGVEEGVWQLFLEEGEMRMYKREEEVDGIFCDPLKAVHSVKGVTAYEYLHYFFEPEYKLDWDTTLDHINVVEQPSEDTSVIHQTHKRIWPSSQRESLFWSHLRRCDQQKDPDAHDLYMVCNHHCVRPDVPKTNKGNVRVGMTVAMVCQTVIEKSAAKKRLSQLTRDDVTCRIIYVAQVNPGGWVPTSAARALYKREYPKFLRRLTLYILSKLNSPSLMIAP